MEKLKRVCEVVYLKWPRRCISSNLSLTRYFVLMLNEYTLGLIVKNFISHSGFRYTFIQRSGEICIKPKDSQIERYLSTKQVTAPTASSSL